MTNLPLIRCEAVRKHYSDGNVVALNDVTLEVRPGEYVAIRGPSGSGKSTLLHLIGLLDVPTSGRILFEGKPVTARRQAEQLRAQRLGFVFQGFHLLPTLTALENVQIPMFEGPLGRRRRQARAEELLEEVGLTHRRQHFPNQLSGGERQRVAIARALANEPVLLLADEPTGNLDSAASEAILQLFDDLGRQRQVTLLVVTHNADVSRRMRRVITLRDGRIQEDRVQDSPSPRGGAPCTS